MRWSFRGQTTWSVTSHRGPLNSSYSTATTRSTHDPASQITGPSRSDAHDTLRRAPTRSETANCDPPTRVIPAAHFYCARVQHWVMGKGWIRQTKWNETKLYYYHYIFKPMQSVNIYAYNHFRLKLKKLFFCWSSYNIIIFWHQCKVQIIYNRFIVKC